MIRRARRPLRRAITPPTRNVSRPIARRLEREPLNSRAAELATSAAATSRVVAALRRSAGNSRMKGQQNARYVAKSLVLRKKAAGRRRSVWKVAAVGR